MDYVEGYRREKRKVAREELGWILSRKVDGIMCLSGEVLELLASVPSDFGVEGVVLYVPSTRLVRLAVELGFSEVVNTNGAETRCILSSLTHL